MARPRKSYNEHELSGTNKYHPERKVWNKKNDRPLTEKPAPAHYLQRTKSAWHQFMAVKTCQQVLSEEDEKSVVMMFDSLDRYFRLSDSINEIYRRSDFSDWLSDSENQKKFKLMNSAIKAENDNFRNWAVRFGMTPTERSKLSVAPEKPKSALLALVEEA